MLDGLTKVICSLVHTPDFLVCVGCQSTLDFGRYQTNGRILILYRGIKKKGEGMPSYSLRAVRSACVVLGLAVPAAVAQTQTPPGTIRLAVDASQAPQKILHAHEQIPAQAGALTLY